MPSDKFSNEQEIHHLVSSSSMNLMHCVLEELAVLRYRMCLRITFLARGLQRGCSSGLLGVKIRDWESFRVPIWSFWKFSFSAIS